VLISTTQFATIPGAAHVEFHPETAKESALAIVRMAIDRFRRRNSGRVKIPNYKYDVLGGFTYESLTDIFKKMNPASDVRALTDAIKSGQIKGVVQFAGCNNQKSVHDENHMTYVKFLAANDVFVISSGCAAQTFAVEGILNPEAIDKYAGPGLKKFLGDMSKAAGVPLPLVFHIGSCVDNTRGHRLLTAMAADMEITIPQLPYVATAPEFMSEKAVAIGSWFVTMGVPVMVGTVPPVTGSPLIVDRPFGKTCMAFACA
jgi:carbon-monoxide dehydrogenase catalytic subunit